jgi:threonine dehydrogenase-like Zn-dependent dehydrogenase
MIRLGVYNSGGFAEYSLLPERALYKISKDLSPELGILIEPIACVVNSLNSIGPVLGKNVVILGGGPMGQLFVQLIKRSGAGKVVLSELSDYRLKLGKINGADLTINPGKDDLEEFLKENIGTGVDIVIDAVGTLLEQALNIAGKGGMVVLFGNDNTAVANIKPTNILLNEIKIINSFAVKNTYVDAIKIVENGLMEPEGIITRKMTLDEVNQGIDLLRKQLELKIMINMA